MESSSELTLPFILFTLLIVMSLRYIHFYVLHRIYGGKLLNIKKSSRNLSFETKQGKFQLSKEHQKLMYKASQDRAWKSLSFSEITDVHVRMNTGSAGMLEFLVSDFNLWDFKGKYRDVVHNCHIRLGVFCEHPDMNLDVTILTMRQFEQREFYIGQFIYELDILVMKKLGLYINIADAREEKINELMQLFRQCGFEPTYQEYKPY